jgi:hypothetical protein
VPGGPAAASQLADTAAVSVPARLRWARPDGTPRRSTRAERPQAALIHRHHAQFGPSDPAYRSGRLGQADPQPGAPWRRRHRPQADGTTIMTVSPRLGPSKTLDIAELRALFSAYGDNSLHPLRGVVRSAPQPVGDLAGRQAPRRSVKPGRVISDSSCARMDCAVWTYRACGGISAAQTWAVLWPAVAVVCFPGSSRRNCHGTAVSLAVSQGCLAHV